MGKLIKKPLYIGGETVWKEPTLDVVYPYKRQKVGEVPLATPEDIKRAIDLAVEGQREIASLSAYERSKILYRAYELLKERAEEFAKIITLEVGKTIREARTEVIRAQQTLLLSAEEAKRIYGETIPYDAVPNGINKVGFYIRVPVGIVAAITPFNFPLNLTMHKVAPALAAGNAVVVKPSERTPLSAAMLAEILYEAGIPKKALSVVYGYAEVGKALTTDERVRVVSFTGSRKVGDIIARQVGIKKLVLELGSNSALIVDKDADLKKAAKKAVQGGFALAGQVCISVQRVFAHGEIFDQFVNLVVEEVKKLKVGDPMDETTDVGPMISPQDVERIKTWIEEAVKDGAKVVYGGKPLSETVFEPTVMTHVPRRSRVCAEEAFAPIIFVNPYKTTEEALDWVNDSDYGLQIGVYTNNLKTAWEFIQKAQVGGVIINDIPTFRADNMPYGGVKYSGIGREGPKFAILEDYTEIKAVAIDLTP
ncbi:MAG TPA: aldehyde dehydrogenase family protein [Aquifex aeolicus]|uniref:Aldehyde dehydrogenase family protein n=1 Tax=Aquifex aeolicus TaxID=63363 RepID=A0A9D1CF34_AQUAO|nr:aldehyde dehydrogenase family protein [Aquificales bacterium]HIP98229.1 aldehyde dehydrogenase family protein [Aquifex aeolicus]HIQ26601.1 aldehyde dehydrogenase family protein [Aquifex aeolicus]